MRRLPDPTLDITNELVELVQSIVVTISSIHVLDEPFRCSSRLVGATQGSSRSCENAARAEKDQGVRISPCHAGGDQYLL